MRVTRTIVRSRFVVSLVVKSLIAERGTFSWREEDRVVSMSFLV